MTAFSAVALIRDTVAAAAEALVESSHSEPLTDPESRLLTTLECLREGLCIVAKRATDPEQVVLYGPELAELFTCAAIAAANGGISIVWLLHQDAAVPKKWGTLPVSPEALAWLGVIALGDDLVLICATHGRPAHPRQLANVRDLQAGLGRLIELAKAGISPDTDIGARRAKRRVRDDFGRAAAILGTDVPPIPAEAAAIRARPR